jgi:hypothetical protein
MPLGGRRLSHLIPWSCVYCRIIFLDVGGRAGIRFANISRGRSAMGRLEMRSGSRPRGNRTPLSGLSPSTSRGNFTLVPVVLVLTLLPVMAFASPPDPSWIAGIYDGSDADDIVILVYKTTATSAPAPSPIPPFPYLLGIVIPMLSDSQFAQGSRAPPAMVSPVSAHVFRFLTPDTSTASATRFQLVTRRPLSLRRTTAPTLAGRMF